MNFHKGSKSEFLFRGCVWGDQCQKKAGGTTPPPPQKKVSRYSLYIIIHIFHIPSSSGSLVLKQTKGVTDGQTDGWIDKRWIEKLTN